MAALAIVDGLEGRAHLAISVCKPEASPAIAACSCSGETSLDGPKQSKRIVELTSDASGGGRNCFGPFLAYQGVVLCAPARPVYADASPLFRIDMTLDQTFSFK